VGVRVDRVLLIAWGISAAIAAVAGILIAGQTTTLSPGMADLYLLSAFAGAVVGGLDSLPGAAVAALCMGVIQNLVAAYISMQWRDAVVFGLLLAVLLIRPAGVFGPVVQRRV
jgi:branched-subunit amino acid ABC-type transport system permease component